MGMPITSYKVLQLLADRSAARGEDEQSLWKILEEFRLLAVVLHDPSRHAPLHDLLSSRFEWLDRVTGPHLLFFSAVEVSPRWRADAEQRSYFSSVERRLQIGHAHAMPTPTIDPELSVVGTALALGIPANELPCVVVFRGGSSEFFWFGTGVSTIERQIERLALAAYSMGQTDAPSPPGGLQRHLSDFEIEQHSSSVGDGSSVAGRLAAILASSVVDPDHSDAARDDVRRAVEVQRRELERILEANRDGGDDLILDVVRCALGLGITIALSRGGTGQLNWLWPPRELWEIEAAASLAAAMKLRTLDDPGLTAAIVMCYGRSFEAEINASVVQGLRQRTGVSLPAYYGRHQPGTKACVEVDIGGRTATIDLNAKRDGGWLPPGLGQSELVANKLGAGGLLESEPWKTLLQEWTTIRQHRNSAAHPRPLHPSSVSDCHGAFLASSRRGRALWNPCPEGAAAGTGRGAVGGDGGAACHTIRRRSSFGFVASATRPVPSP